MRPLTTTAAAAAFLACIVAANVLTSRLGLVDVGFGLTATAGTYLAGLSFVLRDTLQDLAGVRRVVIVIVFGAALSFVLGDARIAIASGVAFLLAELADLAIYTPLRRLGYVRAAVASNVAGSLLDTFLFLAIAGFPITALVVAGQLLAKLTVTAAVVALVVAARALPREPRRA